MRQTRFPFLRARAQLAAAALVLFVNIAGSVPVQAATDLEGSITVTGTGNGPLLNCSCSVNVASAGYVSGLDGTTPFAVSWGTPSASMTLNISEACTLLPTPFITAIAIGNSVSISGAVLIENGVQQNATVTGVFNAQPVSETSTLLVGGMVLTVTTSTATLNITVTKTDGVLSLVPTSEYLCPSPPQPVNFAVSGTLLTAG